MQRCPHQCLPTGVLHTIALTNRSNVHKGDMLSVTSLPRCKRKFKLMRTEDYHEEPRKLYDSTRGSLIHGFLECPDLENVQTEKRLYKTVTTEKGTFQISGQMDFFDMGRRKLEDYKTMADKGLYIIYNYGAKQDHILQLNVYRWLMQGGRLGGPSGEQVNWDVDEIQIHYLLMNRVISTGRVFTEIFNEYKEPNYGRKYGLEVERKMVGKTDRGIPQWHITFDIPKVPMMSFAEIEEYVIQNGETLSRGVKEPDYMPPGIMDDMQLRWECDYCSVKNRCDQIEAAAALKYQDELPF